MADEPEEMTPYDDPYDLDALHRQAQGGGWETTQSPDEDD